MFVNDLVRLAVGRAGDAIYPFVDVVGKSLHAGSQKQARPDLKANFGAVLRPKTLQFSHGEPGTPLGSYVVCRETCLLTIYCRSTALDPHQFVPPRRINLAPPNTLPMSTGIT